MSSISYNVRLVIHEEEQEAYFIIGENNGGGFDGKFEVNINKEFNSDFENNLMSEVDKLLSSSTGDELDFYTELKESLLFRHIMSFILITYNSLFEKT